MKKNKKKFGQYFTPKNIRDELMNLISIPNSSKVLEPSFGTGNFIDSILEKNKNIDLSGYEIDKKLYEKCKNLYPKVNLVLGDFLKSSIDIKYNFIIGNPPYFEFIPTKKIKMEFSEVIEGRCNIYTLFIKKCIELLKEDGILAFVVPTSMNSGKYFSKLRNFIVSTCDILNIVEYGEKEFIGAEQKVMIIILKKSKNTGRYVFRKNGLTIFSTNTSLLNKLYKGKKSLKDHGYIVKTGSIVWNQNKDKLSDENNNVLLVWSDNIRNSNIIERSHKIKKQYISNIIGNNYAAILVNRIVGSSNKDLRISFIDGSREWVAENHVNIITHNDNDKLKKLLKYLVSKDVRDVINLISSNTQLSKTEIENLIPIPENI